MSDFAPRRPPRPNPSNARCIDQWTIRGWNHDPFVFGVENGKEVVIPISDVRLMVGFRLSVGFVDLRDNAGTVRLGTPAEDAPSPWELLAITERSRRAALDLVDEGGDEE